MSKLSRWYVFLFLFLYMPGKLLFFFSLYKVKGCIFFLNLEFERGQYTQMKCYIRGQMIRNSRFLFISLLITCITLGILSLALFWLLFAFWSSCRRRASLNIWMWRHLNFYIAWVEVLHESILTCKESRMLY